MPISEIPSLRLLRHVTSAAYVSVEKVPAFPRLLDSTNVTQWSTLCLWGVFTSGLVHNIWLGNWSGILMLAAALSLSFPDLASIKKSALGWFGSEPGSTASRMRPMFFFCSASHARFTPEKRRFKYPMLYVGFPATLKGGVSGGSRLFSVLPSPTETTTRTPPRSIFTVDPAKYFSPDLSFVEKLHQVLAGHGLDPSQYPHAYVVTSPAFLGYSFNPVSYYYLYSSSYELKLVVLEASNTFGEKHVYVVRADDPSNPPPRKGYTFAGTMEKVFHISPFNHRSGTYTIQVHDPLQPDAFHGGPRVDVHMTVVNEFGKKNMTARAFSTARSFDLERGSAWRGWWVAASWGWISFLVLPQTFWQAAKLHRTKNITVNPRPEPLEGSCRRVATSAERDMQALVLDVLRERVAAYASPVEVKLSLAGKLEVVFRNGAIEEEEGGEGGDRVPRVRLHLRVLNPRFFLRFFSVQDPEQAMWMDYTTRAEIFRPVTVETSGDDDGVELLLRILASRIRGSSKHTSSPWSILQAVARLRVWSTRRGLSSRSTTAGGPSPVVYENTHLNFLDEFYLSGRGPGALKYARMVVYAVLVDVIGFGDAANLELYMAIWYGACMFVGFVYCVARILSVYKF